MRARVRYEPTLPPPTMRMNISLRALYCGRRAVEVCRELADGIGRDDGVDFVAGFQNEIVRSYDDAARATPDGRDANAPRPLDLFYALSGVGGGDHRGKRRHLAKIE